MAIGLRSIQLWLQHPIIVSTLLIFAMLALMMVLGVILDDPAYAKARHDA